MYGELVKVMANDGNCIQRGKSFVQVCDRSELVVSIIISFRRRGEERGCLNHFDHDKHHLKDA